MEITDRLGLLLDLAVLDPPPFQSEGFARWCCQASISLLARETWAQDAVVPLPHGVFPAFTPTIPGLEDLPRFGQEFQRPSVPVVGHAQSVVSTANQEDVDVLVIIYEMVREHAWRTAPAGGMTIDHIVSPHGRTTWDHFALLRRARDWVH